jgi:glycosyltransferase involved in cell wall biosynthesis
MRVLIVHNSGASHLPTGELNVIKNDIRALENVGAVCTLKTVSNDSLNNSFSVRSLFAGITLFWSPASFLLMNRLIDECRPDIVHFHAVLPLLTASAFYACKKRGVPVVQTLHNFRWVCVEGGLFRNEQYCDTCLCGSGWQGAMFGCSKKSRIISLLLFLNNLFYRRTGLLFAWIDKFLAVSEFVRDNYVRSGFPEDKIVIKFNCVSSIPSGQTLIEGKRKGITFAGRLSPAKGTKIIKEIALRSNTHFNIVGSGPDLEELKEFCSTHRLEHVKIWGQVSHDEVLKIISGTQCVVIPSLCGEAFSLIAIEALKTGTPVVATKIGGLEELIMKSGGGLIANPDDPQTFVDAIKKLVDSPEKAKVMGEKGRDYVKVNLNMEASSRRLVSIYEDIIKESGH